MDDAETPRPPMPPGRPPEVVDVATLVARALAEDIGTGDATTAATVPPTARATARLVARAAGVVCGTHVAAEVFRQLEDTVDCTGVRDGDGVDPGQVVMTLRGPARALLTGERVALNFMQRLSGIATLTAQFVQRVAGTGASITDTRKTTPGLRVLEKYAVRCGGGVNHRFGLDDMLMIKENHIAAAGSLEAALVAARAAAAGRAVVVEVRSFAEFETALAGGADRVLLDHWTPERVAAAVARRGARSTPQIEVSGNLSLETVRAYAEAGAGFLSVGALTHSARALDLSLLFEGAGA